MFAVSIVGRVRVGWYKGGGGCGYKGGGGVGGVGWYKGKGGGVGWYKGKGGWGPAVA